MRPPICLCRTCGKRGKAKDSPLSKCGMHTGRALATAGGLSGRGCCPDSSHCSGVADTAWAGGCGQLQSCQVLLA